MPGDKMLRPNAYTTHNSVQLIRGGTGYFSRMEEMINAALYSIHLQVYIFDENETGNRIAEALIKAAQRKVQVYLLVDGYASQRLSDAFIFALREAGMHFAYFEQVFRTRYFYIGRRMHLKVIVVDDLKSMVGGINISDRYNDINNIPAWLDWAIYAEGEVAETLSKNCIALWNKSRLRPKYMPIKSAWANFSNEEACEVRVRKNDWVKGRTEITKSYLEMFRRAQSHIIVMSGYFWPARRLLRKMAAASRRGVKIKLILAGHSDIDIAKHAERYMYRWLLRNNIEIYEYQDNVLHGKIAVYDNRWVTGGSYNVNNISAFASIELNLDVKNNAFAKNVNERLEEIIEKHCEQITEQNYIQNYNYWQKTLQKAAYKTVHFIFFLFTFYFRQDK